MNAEIPIEESEYSNTHLLGVCHAYPGWLISIKTTIRTEKRIQRWKKTHPEGDYGPRVWLKWGDGDFIEIWEVIEDEPKSKLLGTLTPG